MAAAQTTEQLDANSSPTALTVTEPVLRAIVEHSQEMSVLTDADSTIRYASPSCVTVVGWKPEELVGKRCFDLVLEDDWPVLGGAIQSLEGRPGAYATKLVRVTRKDGRQRLIECTVTDRRDDPAIGAFVHNCLDVTERELASEELALARSNLRAIIDNAEDRIVSFDIDGRILKFNDAYQRYIRKTYGIEVRSGMKLVDHLPAADAETWRSLFDRAFTGERFTIERHYHSPGDYAIVEVSFNPIVTSEVVTGVAIFTKDITSERLALARLEQSEHEFRRFFHDVPIPVCVVDPESLRILRVNRAACLLYGYDLEEFVGKSLRDLAAQKNIGSELTLSEMLGESPVQTTSSIHAHKNGERIDVEISSHTTLIEGAPARILMLRDVTERRKAARELFESNERFRLATEAINSVVYEWDIASGKSVRSPGMMAFMGFDHADPDIATKDWWTDRVHPEDRGRIQNHLVLALAGAEHYESEYRMRNKAGRYIYVWDRGLIVRDAAGNATHVVGNAQDITARRQIEAQLEQERAQAIQAREAAEEMNRLKTSFLANMSHEIRTPMTAILGFASVLAESEMDPEHAHFASMIETSATRLLQTINGILDFAKVEARKIELSPAPVDLNLEIGRTTQLLEPLTVHRNIELNFHPTPASPDAVIDAHYFGQIVTNLIGNSIKFTDAGMVNVYVQTGAEAREAVPVPNGFASFRLGRPIQGDYFRLIVEDTGVGIAPESLPNIFKEFKQESSGYERTYEGTGLGLTISSRLVETMGGSIEVRSAQGIGTQFIVCLPRVSASSGIGTDDTPNSRPNLLLVEDSPETATLIAHMLRPQANLAHVSDAKSAMKIVEDRLYDLVLLDLNLGAGPSGIEVARHLRRDVRYNQIRIAALTGYASPSDRQAALDAGCNDYLPKPFTKTQLLDLVKRNLVVVA